MTQASHSVNAAIGLIFASSILPVACVYEETVFVPLQVEFEMESSEALEAEEEVTIRLSLSAASEDQVRVEVQVEGESASGHDRCDGRDYSLSTTPVLFEPGETEAILSLRHLDDATLEMDEVVELRLLSAEGARVGRRSGHVHRILDDDRGVLLDVRADFGAVGDGQVDDTEAIQQAVDRAQASEDPVVFFPSGDYVVSHLDLAPGVVYAGHRATLLQKPGAAEDARLLEFVYGGAVDSSRTRIQGLLLNGQRDLQGEFSDWQFQRSALLYAAGDPAQPGRLVIDFEGLTLEEGGGNGLELTTNTQSEMCDIQGTDVFTDLIKLSGGNSALSIRHLRATGTIGTTGIALTGAQAGFEGSFSVEVDLEDLLLSTGDLEIDVTDSSRVTLSKLQMDTPPFYLRAVRSLVRISDSSLMMGRPELRQNRIVAPGDVTFENCDLILSEMVEPQMEFPEEDRFLAWAEVTWDDVSYAYSSEEEDRLVETLSDQSLSFVDCRFSLADDVEGSDETYAAATVDTDADPSNQLKMSGETLASGFDGLFAPSCSSCTEN